MKKLIYSILILHLIGWHTVLNAQQADTANVAIYHEMELLPLRHMWLQTSNPAAYQYVENNPARIDFSYQDIKGDYKLYSEPGSIHSGNVYSEGYKHAGKYCFYGQFGYNLAKQKNLTWNDVLFISPGNPFTLADSIDGNYDTEIFRIRGGLSAPLPGNKFYWGVLLDYNVGSSADQTDPRPLIRAARYSIRPGLLYKTHRWKLGLDILAGSYKETIDMDVQNTSETHHYFLFMGLGNYYPNSGDSYTRNYKGRSWEGNFQAGFSGLRITNIFQAGFNNTLEVTKDGASSGFFRAGDYKANKASVLNITQYRTGRHTHIFRLASTLSRIKGIWYDQVEVVNDNSQTVWEVYNQSVKYKCNTLAAEAGYLLLTEKKANHHHMLGTTFKYENNQANYYPDGYFMKYSNAIAGMNGEKSFAIKSLGISIGINAGYRFNLTKDAALTGIKLADIISRPVYDYYTSGVFFGAGSIAIGKSFRQNNKDFFSYIKIHLSYNEAISQTLYYNNTNRVEKTITLGFKF